MPAEIQTVREHVQEHVSANLTMVNIWHRLGRVVVVGLGAIVTLGRLPTNTVEWCGFGLALAGAIWTGTTPDNGGE